MRAAHLLVVAALVGAGTLAYLASRDDGPERLRAAAPPAQLRWTPGDRQLYSVTIESSAKIQLLGKDLPQPLRQRLTGTLYLLVVACDGDRVRVGFRLAPLRMRVEGDAEGDKEQTADGPPFLATFDRSGRVLEFLFPDAASRQLRELLEETVRTFECIVPFGAGETWTAPGRHNTGPYRAEYTRRPDGMIARRKTGYDAPGGSITIRRSKESFRLSPTSWLDHASISTRLLIENEDKARVQHSNWATLAPLPPTMWRGDNLLELGRSHAEACDIVRRHQLPASAAASRAPPAKPTKKQVRETVLGINASDGDDATFILQLSKQLAADPAYVALAVEALEAEGTTDGADAALLNALGTAGTPEAQAALTDVALDPRRRHHNRLRATVAIGLGALPTEDALDGLWQAAGDRGDKSAIDLSNTSLLALGTATGTLGRRRSPLAGPQASRLVARLRGGSDRHETEVVLKALGNTCDLAFADEIAGHLDASEFGVRTSAAYALRTMGREATADLLADRLTRETHPSVRQALATSLNRLGVTTRRALAVVHAQIENEKDEATRHAMAELLARHIADVPAYRPTLSRLLRKETSSRIAKRLAEALYGGKQR